MVKGLVCYKWLIQVWLGHTSNFSEKNANSKSITQSFGTINNAANEQRNLCIQGNITWHMAPKEHLTF
jgi:hypothetical protein